MSIEITIGILAGSVMMLGLAFYKIRQPVPINKPWAVPWHGVLFLAIIITLLMINHLFSQFK